MKTKLRILLFLVAIIGAVTAPPWVPLVAIAIAAIRFPAWEVLVAGLLIDFVWLPASPFSLPLFTIASLISVWGFEPLRREFLIGKGLL